jgi:hypothetical protein
MRYLHHVTAAATVTVITATFKHLRFFASELCVHTVTPHCTAATHLHILHVHTA